MSEWYNTKPIPSPLIVVSNDHETLLKNIAATALCAEPSPCGQCPACKQVTKGFHPDWLHLSAPFKVEDIRDALYKLRLHPYSAAKRVLSLNGFESANSHVQNALLKTLEEPQAHWILLIGTTSLLTLLPTIRSRCLVMRNHAAPPVQLTADQRDFFEAVRKGDEAIIHRNSETLFKEKAKAKETLVQCLHEASRQAYPGHWRNLAPDAEMALHYIQRNLNPRLVWDEIWNKSLIHESH